MSLTKQELYERGVALAVALCKKNHWKVPVIKNSPRLRSTGLYTHSNRHIQVNVNDTAWLVNKPTVRRQSHPGWKTDRTAHGVVLHELGHYVWFVYGTGAAHLAWRKVCRAAQHERVSGYEPCPEEAFAETFRLWALNPMLLKAACPERYAVLKKVFGLRHPRRRQWQAVLPVAFHGRAKQWIAR